MLSKSIMGRILVLWMGLALLFGGLPALAQRQPPGTLKQRCMTRFKTLDSNQDGTLTLDEFAAVAHYRGKPENIFQARDVNADGRLTPEELCTNWRK